MYSVTITPGKILDLAQPLRGFKGIAVTGSGKQVLQPLSGFKGFAVEAAVEGYAFKIKHFR
jgi:hypothetical protein